MPRSATRRFHLIGFRPVREPAEPMVPMTIRVAEKLGLSGRAADWTSPGDLARQTSTSPAMLRELLNQLVTVGLFERLDGRYRAIA